MKSKDLANGKNHVGKTSVEEIAANQVKPADIIWVKNHGGSWWPAQVVDENLVSESSKPSKRSAEKVLVRLYGTYTYSYVDPIKCHSEFDEILKQNNNSYRDIFLKALEKDVTRLKSSKSKKQRSKSKVTKDASNKASKRGEGKDEVKKKSGSQSKSRGGDEGEGKSRKRKIEQDGMQKKRGRNDQSTGAAANNTTPKYDMVLKKIKLNGSSSGKISFARSQELSARRLKVMQSLGLAAPTGSPFCKSRQIFVTP
ncbi:hypothetical protein TIFTF001_009368 [Ficus carica]|uniref:PWWP domain-containing protein n=1 Tax=Ficus carica TaxID=3494 RepID=A0AA87ZUI3_FICCA|nr:hypothetical protein TIFTF001_009368 [Ficus carica]